MIGHTHDIDLRDAERSFEEFFTSCGFSLPSGGLKLDGKIHRFRVGDKSDLSGSYQFWPDGLSHDGRPHGWVQDWHEGGDKRYWQYRAEGGYEYKPTPEEIAAREARTRADEARAAETFAAAMDKLVSFYESAHIADKAHPYLVRKGIVESKGELRQQGDLLIVPFRRIADPEHSLGTAQCIPGSGGNKKFAKGVSPIASDAAYIIRGSDASSRVFIAEGVATADSIAAALSSKGANDYRAVLAAGSCNRLMGVAKAAREVYPDAKIFIMADDDFRTQLKHGRNPGLDKANEVVRAGLADGVCIPPFPRDLDDVDAACNAPTDWNDHAVGFCLEATTAAIEKAVAEATSKRAQTEKTSTPKPNKVTAQRDENDGAPPRPIIIESSLHLRDAVSRCTEAFVKMNEVSREPIIYVNQCRGSNSLAQIVEGRNGRSYIREITSSNAGLLMSESADFMRVKSSDKQKSMTPTKPSSELIKSFVNAGRWEGLPILKGLSQMPIVRSDWSIQTKPGYDEITGIYYDGEYVPFNEHPTQQDARDAALALGDVIIDFAFEGRDDGDLAYMANALGFLVSCALRDAGVGLMPMTLIDAPRAGSGKSLLALAASVILCNKRIATQPAANKSDEWRKLITTVLLNDMPMILFDNAKNGSTIDDPNLARFITSDSYGDRILGGNTNADILSRSIVVMTGNNPKCGADILRRINHIRLNDGQEHAGDRKHYVHPERKGTKNFLTYVESHRGEIIGHILTMIRAWADAGSPPWSGQAIDSFEEWSKVVGGILEYAGITSFQSNRARDIVQMSTVDTRSWGLFLFEARSRMNCEPFPIRALVKECKEDAGFFEMMPLSRDLTDPHAANFPGALGKWFDGHKDSAFNVPGGKLTIVHTDASHRKGGTIWMLALESGEEAA